MNYYGSLKLQQSFKKYLLTITILSLKFLLIACSPGIEEQALETQPITSPTPGLSATATPSQVPASTATQEVIPTANVIPEPNATPTALTPTVTPTATWVTDPVTTVQQQCVTSDPILVHETETTEGLMLHGTWEGKEGAAILGKEGLDKPLLFVPDPERQIVWPYESPDKEWVAYTEMLVDSNEDAWFIEIVVWNPDSNEKIRTTFEGVKFLPYDATLRWINNDQLIIPLQNEGELFRWLVWSPFSGEEEILSVELDGIGNQMERFRNPPVLDPFLEMVVYPCEFCDEGEYAVKNIVSGETMWFIDLGPEPSHVHRSSASWSPDGRFVTVIGGKFLNQLLFLNREGEKSYEITLPVLDDPGGLVIFTRTWSPNSEYLAFLRVTGSAGNYEDTLTFSFP